MNSDSALFSIFTIVCLAIVVVAIASMWKVFTKAGKPGWACIIPIYNLIILLEIIGRPAWWIILYFIPIANIVVLFLVSIDLSKSFGKDAGFGIGLALLSIVFYPILAFSDAKYVGPVAQA